MKNYLLLMIVGLCVIVSGCNYTGTPVEWANTCDKANDDKSVEVVGYFKNTGSAMCSNSVNSPTMRCPVDFLDSPTSEKIAIRAHLDKGSGASSIDNPEDKGLKIKDDKGEYVENSQKVKIVADVKVLELPASQVGKSAACYLTVKKVEKVQ
jgi:hypothetical protein